MSVLDEMKKEIMEFTKEKKKKFKEVEEPWETMTLYHGTTTRFLNDILKNGIKPRKTSGINNFEETPSNEELVYLTTRWHYWYALNANQESLIREVGEKRFEDEPISKLWNETSDFPMYISCEVPVEVLTIDEDIVYQRNLRKGIASGELKPENMTLDMCLGQGTVASITEIKPEWINEISIIGNEEFRTYLQDGGYGADISGWFNGFGMGDTDMLALTMVELTHFGNGNEVLEVAYPPEENKMVKRIYVDEEGMHIEHIEESKTDA